MFLLPNRVQYCLSSFTLLRTSSLVTLSRQLIFSILLHIHISKAPNLLFVCVNIHVSAAHSVTLQTKHFIILFFSSRFILTVNNFLFSINTFFAISILLLDKIKSHQNQSTVTLHCINYSTHLTLVKLITALMQQNSSNTGSFLMQASQTADCWQ